MHSRGSASGSMELHGEKKVELEGQIEDTLGECALAMVTCVLVHISFPNTIIFFISSFNQDTIKNCYL